MLNTLGELEGFITAHACDVNVIVGDFNVDFDRGSPLAKLLNDFILEFGLLACDLNFRPSVCYTYESDDSCTRSWLDHILCSQHISSLRSASISSDHYPLFFQINISCSHSPCSLPVSSASHVFILIGLECLQLTLKTIITWSHALSVIYHQMLLGVLTLIAFNIMIF